MKKTIVNILVAAAIILIGSTCFGQTKPAKDTLKRYPGYKYALPCVVKGTRGLTKHYYYLTDTFGIKGSHVMYKGWDITTGQGQKWITERGTRPVKPKDKGKY